MTVARTEREIRFLEDAMLHALDEAGQYLYQAGQNATVVGLDTASLWNEYQRLLSGRKSLAAKVLANREERMRQAAVDVLDNLSREEMTDEDFPACHVYMEDGSDGQGN